MRRILFCLIGMLIILTLPVAAQDALNLPAEQALRWMAVIEDGELDARRAAIHREYATGFHPISVG